MNSFSLVVIPIISDFKEKLYLHMMCKFAQASYFAHFLQAKTVKHHYHKHFNGLI